jgi:hypothetical protein
MAKVNDGSGIRARQARNNDFGLLATSSGCQARFPVKSRTSTRSWAKWAMSSLVLAAP